MVGSTAEKDALGLFRVSGICGRHLAVYQWLKHRCLRGIIHIRLP